MSINNELYKMKLHECLVLFNIEEFVMRVPGGWVYSLKSGPVFVPFNNEFQKESKVAGCDVGSECPFCENLKPCVWITTGRVLCGSKPCTVHERS
jgi:hypothetical protein